MIRLSPEEIFSDPGDRYSDRTALALAEHAVAAYMPPGEFSASAKAAGFDDGAIVAKRAAQVAVAWHRSAIVVSARGSSGAGDWRDDAASAFRAAWTPPLPESFTFTDGKGRERTGRPRIGRGFRRQAAEIAPGLRRQLDLVRQSCPEAPIAVTGHSLGAALVPLLVADLSIQGFTGIRVAYAFASPRVGNAAFAGWYEDAFCNHHILAAAGPGGSGEVMMAPAVTPTYSVVNVINGTPDIVTRFPRRYWGFRHLGRRVILAGDRTLFGDEEWQAFRTEHPVEKWRVFTRTARSVRAHLGRQLLRALRARAPAGLFHVKRP